jgi:hypothetical protein
MSDSKNKTSTTLERFWETRKWHWDPTKIDSVDHKLIARVPGDYMNEVQKDELTFLPNGYNSKGDLRGYKGKKNLAYQKEKVDVGFTKETVYYDSSNTLTPKLTQLMQTIGNAFDLSQLHARIHKQKPGSILHLHTDRYQNYPARANNPGLDLTRVVRLAVALSDWDHGHLWLNGNTPWVQWKAGDVIHVEFLNVPHCTANCGKTPRYTMLMMGIKGKNTDRLFEGDTLNLKLDKSKN